MINAKKPAIIQVLPREMGSYIYFFYDMPPPIFDLRFYSVLQKSLTVDFLPEILNIYAL